MGGWVCVCGWVGGCVRAFVSRGKIFSSRGKILCLMNT